MTDIIWGNVSKILSNNNIEINVTHRKDGNQNDYQDLEKILIQETDIVTIPTDPNQRTIPILEQYLMNQFVKCEISKRDGDFLLANVSHSGQGGY